MKNLYIMVGIAGAGKSTWVKDNVDKLEGTVNVVSRDKIRFEMLDNGDDYFKKENEVWIEFIDQIISSSKKYDNTIVDATHITKGSRKKLLKTLGRYIDLYKINKKAVVILNDVDIAIKNNHQREGRALVPDNVIKEMSEHFEFPKKEEGFDQIIVVKGGSCS